MIARRHVERLQRVFGRERQGTRSRPSARPAARGDWRASFATRGADTATAASRAMTTARNRETDMSCWCRISRHEENVASPDDSTPRLPPRLAPAGPAAATRDCAVPSRSSTSTSISATAAGRTRCCSHTSGRWASRRPFCCRRAGSVSTPSTHDGVSNGLQAQCLGNEACRQFAKAHCERPSASAPTKCRMSTVRRAEIERYLKLRRRRHRRAEVRRGVRLAGDAEDLRAGARRTACRC